MNRLLLAAGVALLASASPAHADHAGLTDVGGAGASLNVLSADTLEPGQTSAGIRITYTKPDQRSDEALEALAGQHIHAHDSDYSLNGALGLAYGVTDRLTLSAELPYVRREGLRAGEHSHSGGAAINEVVSLGDVAGVGDLGVIAKYRLVDSDGTRFALIGGLKLPTGETDGRGDNGERLETEHQPGSGSWDPLLGAAFATKLGALGLTASALYQVSGEGAQDTRLGDRAQGGVALSRRFGPPEHHDEAGEEHGHASWDLFLELTGEWEGRQEIAGEEEEGSGGKAVWLSPGARFNSAHGWSVAGVIGLPVWQDIRPSHPDNDYRLTVAVGRAF